MKKNNTIVSTPNFYIYLFTILVGAGTVHSQQKSEREHRIKKVQFPESALTYIENKLEDAGRIRFYKEVDHDMISYQAKFKKDRLKYSMEFDDEGRLTAIEFVIKSVDIPNDVYDKIIAHLNDIFNKYRILKIRQQYPLEGADANTDVAIKNAFQNLMLSTIKYKFEVKGKKESGFEQYELLFDAVGKFEMMRKALPANYDHVLY